MMEMLMLILHLSSGEVAKVPVALAAKKLTCSNAIVQVTTLDDNGIHFKGSQVLGYYCKDMKDTLVP